VSAPVRVAPWDESWVKVHRLTRPMVVVLYDVAERDTGTGTIRRLYPGGQWRLIRNGLYARGLIDEWSRVTMAGHVLAIWAQAAVRRAYPSEGNRS
jgi:hypothetical protein